MKNFKSITGLALISLLMLFSAGICQAQTLGTKKNVTLKLLGYECGDFCGIEFKDVSSGKVYSFENIDDKTQDNGIIAGIQKAYYDNGESDSKLVGKTYKAVIEFRKTDILSNDEIPKKTGKKKKLTFYTLLLNLLNMKNYKIALLILCFLGIVGILNAQTKAKSQTPTPTSIQPASGIFTHYSQKEIIVGFNNPAVLANYIVYQQDGIYVRGYYGWAAQGMQDLYFGGIRKGNTLYGKSYNLYDKSEQKISMTFSGNAVTVNSPMGIARVPAKKKEMFEGMKKNIYESPNLTSKVLATDMDLQNKGFKLVEIGEMGKLEDTEDSSYDVWYKIKNDTLEGWVLGLLRVF